MNNGIQALAIVAAMTVPGRAGATELETLVESMQPGTWASLPTDNIDATLTNTGGSSNFIFGYAETMRWDPVTRRAFYIGSDHGGDFNEASYRFVVYDEATNAWSVLPQPPWSVSPPGAYYDAHGYDQLAIDPEARKLYRRPYNSTTIHAYDLDTGEWSELPPEPGTGGSCCDAIEVFPELGGLVWSRGTDAVLLFSTATQEWSILGSGNGLASTWMYAEYSPVEAAMLLGSSDGPLFRLSADGTLAPLADPEVPIYDGSAWNGVVTHDVVSGEYLVLTPSTREFWSYAIGTQTWAMLPNQPPVDLSDGAVVAAPIDTYGVTMFTHCKANACGVLVYQHAPCEDCPGGPGESDTGDSGGSSSDGDSGNGTTSGDSAASESGVDVASSSEDGSSSSPPPSSGESDSDASGCGCTHRAGPPAFAWLLLLGLLRRRSRIIGALGLAACADPGGTAEGGETTNVGSSTTVGMTSSPGSSDGPGSSATSSSGSSSGSDEDSTAGGSESEGGSTTSDAPPPPCTEGDSVIGPIAEAMTPGEWRDISDVFPAYPENFYDIADSVFVYTDEAQWDSVRRRVFFIGQAHHSNNDEDPSTAARFYAYHECANEWQQLPDITTNPGEPSAGNIGHQYDHSALDEERGLFFHAPYNTKALYVYDIEEGQWSREDQPAEYQAPISYDITQGIEFVPAFGVVWFTSAWGISAFDPETAAWSSIADPVGGDTYHELARYSPAHDALLLGGGNGSQDLWRLDSDGSLTPIATAPQPIGITSSRGFLAAGSDMLLFDDAGSLWTYDIPGDTWAEHSTVPVPSGQQLNVHLDTHGVVLVLSYNEGVWLYRHG